MDRVGQEGLLEETLSSSDRAGASLSKRICFPRNGRRPSILGGLAERAINQGVQILVTLDFCLEHHRANLATFHLIYQFNELVQPKNRAESDGQVLHFRLWRIRACMTFVNSENETSVVDRHPLHLMNLMHIERFYVLPWLDTKLLFDVL